MKINKNQVIIASVILLIVLLNPTSNDFKEYIGGDYNNRKDNNFLLFSIYSHRVKGRKEVYIGVLKNFILYDDYQEY